MLIESLLPTGASPRGRLIRALWYNAAGQAFDAQRACSRAAKNRLAFLIDKANRHSADNNRTLSKEVSSCLRESRNPSLQRELVLSMWPTRWRETSRAGIMVKAEGAQMAFLASDNYLPWRTL
jgi:hypothetical protein